MDSDGRESEATDEILKEANKCLETSSTNSKPDKRSQNGDDVSSKQLIVVREWLFKCYVLISCKCGMFFSYGFRTYV